MIIEMITAGLDKIEGQMKALSEKSEKKIEDLVLKNREFADEILQLKQRGHAPGPEIITKGVSMGSQVWAGMTDNGELLAKTKSLRLEIKAASDVITTTNMQKIATGGFSMPTGAVLGIQNALPQRPYGGLSTLEYSRYTGVQGAAAVQAGEGAAKAAIRPDFTAIQQGAITIAGYTKLSKQSLSDRQELMQAVDVTLRRSISLAVDDMLMDGSTTPAFSGFNTLGTSYTSLVYTTLADAASEAIATMQEAGFEPNVVAFRPSDFLGVQLAKTTAGEYLAGPYLQPLPELLRGMRVVLSANVPSGKVVVADTAHLELLVIDDFTIEIGYVDQDFTKNVATILGEVRLIPTFRATGCVRIITPKAP